MTDLSIVHTGSALKAFEPNSLPELLQLAEVMARSEMVPKDFVGQPGNIVVAIMAAREVGLSAYQGLQSFAVIGGRATMWGDAVLGLVRASGQLAEFDEGTDGEGEDRFGWCNLQRVGDKPKRETFSVKDARTANLWSKKGPWQDYPDRMLKLRARSFALRDNFPDVLKGIAVREEVEDFALERNITPAGDTRTAQLRNRLADMMGAGGVAGDVEPPLPNVSAMLAVQIRETVEAEANARQMPVEVLREIIKEHAGGRLVRSTAIEVIKAIRRWERPAGDPPVTHEPPYEWPKPALKHPNVWCLPCALGEEHDDAEVLICPTHERPAIECETADCGAKALEFNRRLMGGMPGA